MTKREEPTSDLYVARPQSTEQSDFNLEQNHTATPAAPVGMAFSDKSNQDKIDLDEAKKYDSISPPSSPEEEPSMTWIMFRELVETIVLSLIIFLLMRQVVQNYRIESQSMETNFCEGQFILVNKLAYTLGEPTRGDVVVFHNPSNQDEDYIKRIIGLPGDTIEIRNQEVFVNGGPLDEPYLHNKNSTGELFGPLVVESDRLFVMGDNRTNSSDSRASVGQLPQELLVGKAWLRVWPFDRWGLIQHFGIDPGVSLGLDIVPGGVCPDTN